MVHTSHLSRLSISLPITTTHVEKMFLVLKLIKTDWCTSMSNTTLSGLMEVYHEGPTLENFHTDAAIQLWWEGCKTNRRPNQGIRKQYRARKPGELAQDDSTSSFSLDDWDVWQNPLRPCLQIVFQKGLTEYNFAHHCARFPC